MRQCLTLIRNDKERFLQIKNHGSPVDPVYKEYKSIKAERVRIDNELRLIAQFEEIDEKFQSGKIDRAEALVLVRGMRDEEERRLEEVERRINSGMSILKTISMLEKFNIDNLEEAFHRITDDNFANGFASGVKILAQLKK